MTTPDIVQITLNRAADRIAERGWWNGCNGEEVGEEALCAQLAIAEEVAIHRPTYNAVMEELSFRITGKHLEDKSKRFVVITEWNDSRSSVDEVLRVMRGQ